MRSILVVGGTLAVTIGTIIVACSFPDVRFEPATAFKDGAFVGTDAKPLVDGPITTADGDIVFDGACNGPDPTCDCDNDGVKSNVSGCGGFDCDDTDPRVNPDAGFRTDVPAQRLGDWNCNNVIEPEGPEGFRCSDTQFTTGQDASKYVAECSVKEGFVEKQSECSKPTTYVFCKYNQIYALPACNDLRTEQRFRGCK